jgi:hypothetical protein
VTDMKSATVNDEYHSDVFRVRVRSACPIMILGRDAELHHLSQCAV